MSENAARRKFPDLSVRQLAHVLAQTNPLDVVSHEEQLLGRVNQVVQVDHTRVGQSFQALNFPLTGFFLHGILELHFFVNFHGILPLVALVQHQSNLSVCTRPNHFANLIIVEGFLLVVVLILVVEVQSASGGGSCAI